MVWESGNKQVPQLINYIFLKKILDLWLEFLIVRNFENLKGRRILVKRPLEGL